MAFLFYNKPGGSPEYVSLESLRKRLLNLKGDYPARNYLIPTTNKDSTLETMNLMAKLRVSLEQVFLDDILKALENVFTQDEMNILFTLSREHFLAIVFLIHENRVSDSELKTILKSRTDQLIKFFSKTENIEINLSDRLKLHIQHMPVNNTLKPMSGFGTFNEFINRFNSKKMFHKNFIDFKKDYLPQKDGTAQKRRFYPHYYYFAKNYFLTLGPDPVLPDILKLSIPGDGKKSGLNIHRSDVLKSDSDERFHNYIKNKDYIYAMMRFPMIFGTTEPVIRSVRKNGSEEHVDMYNWGDTMELFRRISLGLKHSSDISHDLETGEYLSPYYPSGNFDMYRFLNTRTSYGIYNKNTDNLIRVFPTGSVIDIEYDTWRKMRGFARNAMDDELSYNNLILESSDPDYSTYRTKQKNRFILYSTRSKQKRKEEDAEKMLVQIESKLGGKSVLENFFTSERHRFIQGDYSSYFKYIEKELADQEDIGHILNTNALYRPIFDGSLTNIAKQDAKNNSLSEELTPAQIKHFFDDSVVSFLSPESSSSVNLGFFRAIKEIYTGVDDISESDPDLLTFDYITFNESSDLPKVYQPRKLLKKLLKTVFPKITGIPDNEYINQFIVRGKLNKLPSPSGRSGSSLGSIDDPMYTREKFLSYILESDYFVDNEQIFRNVGISGEKTLYAAFEDALNHVPFLENFDVSSIVDLESFKIFMAANRNKLYLDDNNQDILIDENPIRDQFIKTIVDSYINFLIDPKQSVRSFTPTVSEDFFKLYKVVIFLRNFFRLCDSYKNTRIGGKRNSKLTVLFRPTRDLNTLITFINSYLDTDFKFFAYNFRDLKANINQNYESSGQDKVYYDDGYIDYNIYGKVTIKIHESEKDFIKRELIDPLQDTSIPNDGGGF